MKQLSSIATFLTLACLAWSQSFPVPQNFRGVGSNIKVENGATLFWRVNSTAAGPQVQVASTSGQPLFVVDVVSSVAGAVKASVADVSRGRSGRVAVAAVAVDRQQRPVAMLLVYSAEGNLTRAVALHTSREISRLEVDTDDSVWTLCGAGDGEFVVHYSPDGQEMSAMVPRQAIAEVENGDLEADLQNGPTSFGITKDRVWFWVPSAWTRVSVGKDGSLLRKERIGPLERPAGASPDAAPQVLRVVESEGGAQAVQALWVGNRRAVALYVRESQTGAWKLDARRSYGRLLGSDGTALALLRFGGAERTVEMTK